MSGSSNRRQRLQDSLRSGTDLPVLLSPGSAVAGSRAGGRDALALPRVNLKAWHGVVLVLMVLLSAGVAEAQSGDGREGILSILIKWSPLLLQGFVFNLVISVMSMALGTISGAFLGLMQISLLPQVRFGSWFVTQFFRNAPWLVLLFYAMFMLPFQFQVAGVTIPFPDWVKAVIGLSLPVMANVSELVRGAVQSIPSGQWEAAESLAFTRRQQIWQIIMPQCVKRMLPPWMNLYAILTMATVLASIVGVNEVMTLADQVKAAEGGRTDLLAPLYGYILFLFFIYSYPIARLTVRLERRYAVKI
ncbi:amino acid ABC transporter permease [Fodinicurvata sediminis]|uniref:amino acid ABC transporter permease n=1 Tax=Fodinicurvata sediminis TaxID=1121832 RepID=UPI0003B3BD34|nr:amino acid ABC transporter permease [Fodinicurvata sediminis]